MSLFKKIFSREVKERAVHSLPVNIVSGLPRSGTSMMMNMLTAGGLSAVVDSVREADEDNPNGYFEVESSKRLKDGDNGWLYNSQGKLVKIISYLLEYLPDDLDYNIIFMERDLGEILASQRKMLARRSEESALSDAEMEAKFREHLRAIKFWTARKSNIRILFVKYNQMVESPEILCKSIVDFLGVPLDMIAMQSVPNKSLYRNRS